jgi:hypothetical protein
MQAAEQNTDGQRWCAWPLPSAPSHVPQSPPAGEVVAGEVSLAVQPAAASGAQVPRASESARSQARVTRNMRIGERIRPEPYLDQDKPYVNATGV